MARKKTLEPTPKELARAERIGEAALDLSREHDVPTLSTALVYRLVDERAAELAAAILELTGGVSEEQAEETIRGLMAERGAVASGRA